jgi:hypothetical protein
LLKEATFYVSAGNQAIPSRKDSVAASLGVEEGKVFKVGYSRRGLRQQVEQLLYLASSFISALEGVHYCSIFIGLGKLR